MQKKYLPVSHFKKLMKIIYQKQQKLAHYKHLLRNKQNTHPPTPSPSSLTISSQQKQLITKQIHQNMQFLSTATNKLNLFQQQITKLHQDLSSSQNHNLHLETEIISLQTQCQNQLIIIQELSTSKTILGTQNHHYISQINRKQQQITLLKKQLQSISIKSDHLKSQNTTLNKQLFNIKISINKAYQNLHQHLHTPNKISKSNINIKISQQLYQNKQIKTSTLLSAQLEENFHIKVSEIINALHYWSISLTKRQQQWKKHYEKALSDHSLNGLSNLILSSILIKDNSLKTSQKVQNNFYQTSVYKRNQQFLLTQLQKQCQHSFDNPIQYQKQNIIQLSQIKQSLKITKQINQQLFLELNQQSNIIKLIKQTFKCIDKQQLMDGENHKNFKKLQAILHQLQ